MRVFWAILIVAGLAGLALLFVPSSNGTAETPVADEPTQAAAPQPARTPEARPETRPEPQAEPVSTAQAQPTPEPVAVRTPEPVATPAEVAEAPAEAPIEVAAAPAEMPADREPLKDDPAAEVPVAEGPTPALGLEEAGDAMGKLLASLNAFGRAMGGDADTDAGTDATAETEIAATDTETTADATPAPSRTLDDAVQALNQQQTAAATEPAAPTPAAPAQSDTQTADAQAQASLPIDATIQKDDGTLEIGGGEWVLPGDGTTAKPYIISWDLLQSAMQVYNPRLGKTELPEWAQKLEGKRVRIEGYVVLPLAQQSSNDVLLTLNQWDGCCIGVPPTPYDAIEVRLNGAVDAGPGAGMGPLYGSIEGDFKTDPYVAGGWLLGLYVLEEGKLTLMGRR